MVKSKIAWVMDQIITCGGVLIPIQYNEELNKRGYESNIYSNGRNNDLEKAYNFQPKAIDQLAEFTAKDIIIAVWWPQMPQLEKYKGRKIQFVQGNDLLADTGDDFKRLCKTTRNLPFWETIAVSKYAGDWVGRNYEIVPNFVHDRFFKGQHLLTRDIDVLIEGNNEKIKKIDQMIEMAKSIGGKIHWLGRETKEVSGIETFRNPPQEEIPNIYRRAKTFIKLSESEGFSLPILEAMASGCLVITENMGGNDFCHHNYNCYIKGQLKTVRPEKIKENAIKTAKQYTIDNSINKLNGILKLQSSSS